MTVVRLADAHDEGAFGGKAVQLGTAIRAGLPVPDGCALHSDIVAAIANGDQKALSTLDDVCAQLSGALAVRSSAIGEDSAAASFAGQHATVLNVRGSSEAAAAVGEVWRSAWSDAALAYRERVGAGGAVKVGVVVQKLVDADVAGVMFTRNPVTHADELVIEASWGIGEAVVQGLVVPDFYRVASTGEVRERIAGSKKVAVRLLPSGKTAQTSVAPDLVDAHCLADPELRALAGLAARCVEAFGTGPHDVEWAFAQGSLYLLQRRPVTTSHATPRA